MNAEAAGGNQAIDGLEQVLRRELDAARARLEQARARRLRLQRDLDTTAAAENEALKALDALQAVAAQAIDLVPGWRETPERVDEECLSTDGSCGPVSLAGGKLREMATIVALRRAAHATPVHWRTWLGWLRQEGFDAAGKKAEATFLTQLARSPLVRRTQQDGVYLLDVNLFESQRDTLRRLHEQLSRMPPPEQLTMMGDAREQRRVLQGEIARLERSVEEMWRVLRRVPPPEWPDGVDPIPEQIVSAWLALAGAPQAMLSDTQDTPSPAPVERHSV
jgi:hypothetical protein